MESDKK